MKLSELLQLVIGKLNKAVSTDPQELSESQQRNARNNLGVGVTDWAEIDESSPKYIHNKPFGEQLVPVVPSTSFVVTDDGYTQIFEYEDQPIRQFKDGQTYTVILDSVAYVGVARSGSMIDSAPVISLGEIEITCNSGIYVYAPGSLEAGSEHTIAIFTSVTIQLDEKYISDSIARVSDIPGACITDSELATLADLLGVTLEGETNTTQE